jgi:hypothetical protein
LTNIAVIVGPSQLVAEAVKAPTRLWSNRKPVGEIEELAPDVAGDGLRDHEPELVHDAGGEQGLGDRDAAVDADVATRAALQVVHEVHQGALDRGRVGVER